MSLEQAIGQRIRDRREQMGLSQAQFGKLVGEYLGTEWVRQAVSAAEKGRRAFVVAELVAISLALRLSVPQLIGTASPDGMLETVTAGPRLDERADELIRLATLVIEEAKRIKWAYSPVPPAADDTTNPIATAVPLPVTTDSGIPPSP